MNLMRRTGKQTVAVAMSGGIDSSVTAALLKAEGLDVIGVFMKNWDFSDEKGEHQCSYTKDRKDMEDVCKFLKIPSVHVEFSKEYWNEVFTPFLQSYQSGMETPNPDVYCNRYVKFHHFKKYIQEKLGIQDLATGHYAKISRSTSVNHQNPVKLLRAQDPTKDQTYFLAMTSGSALQNVHFPIGHLLKSQVKEYAKIHLPLLNLQQKKESMGICFIGKRDMKDFLSEFIHFTPGRFIDIDTLKVLGEHSQQEYYTIGQGAKIGGRSDRYYIIDKIIDCNLQRYKSKYSDLRKGDILIGAGRNHPALFSSQIEVPNSVFNWISGTEPMQIREKEGIPLQYKVRHSPLLGNCTAHWIEDRGSIEIRFAVPHRAVTPGQILVLYDGEECLGGAPIPSVFDPLQSK